MNERTNTCNYGFLHQGKPVEEVMALQDKDSSKPCLDPDGGKNSI